VPERRHRYDFTVTVKEDTINKIESRLDVKLDVYDDIIALTVPGRNAKAVFGGDLPKEEEQ
jgi:hypothetical protein